MALKIALLGDICLTGKFDLESNRNAIKQFEKVKSLLDAHDLVIANLESPLTDLDTSCICKAIHIKSPPINTVLLQYLGVSAVTLANNHTFDYGLQGYLSTLTALEVASIGYFGTQDRQLLIEKNNERILLGGYCCLSANPSFADRRGVNTLSHANVERFLEDAKARGAFPILSVHWGDENIHYPREDHVRLARLLAKKYAFLLHGHHPHVVQGLESTGGSLIAYSLGNFCTDEHTSRSIKNMTVRHTPENRQSYLLSVTIENGGIVTHEVIPIVDLGDALILSEEAKGTIAYYSAKLGKTDMPYRRPIHEKKMAAHEDPTVPRRYSLSWFVVRINYYFIGAVLKGIINQIRYKLYFSIIRKKAITQGMA